MSINLKVLNNKSLNFLFKKNISNTKRIVTNKKIYLVLRKLSVNKYLNVQKSQNKEIKPKRMNKVFLSALSTCFIYKISSFFYFQN